MLNRVFMFLFLISLVNALLPYLTTQDIDSLRNVFLKAVQSQQDLASVSYGAAGLKSVGQKIPDVQKLCAFAQSQTDQGDVESLYQAALLAETIGNCQLNFPKAQETLVQGISEDKSGRDIYHSVLAMKSFSFNVDNAKLESALAGTVKKDDSAGNLAYVFHVAVLLPGNLKAYVDRIEDTVAQADEVDGRYLQFEGGLSVTAIGVSGMYVLLEKANQTPSIKSDEAVKFANYLMSRRGVQLPRPAYHLLKALQLLTTNKYHIPVSFSLASGVAVTQAEPTIVVRICNLLGNTVGSLTVTIDTATHAPTSGVVINRQPLTAVAGDKTSTLYQLKFLETKKEKGFYKLVMSAGSQKDKRLIGTQGAELNVKVMTEMQVEEVELSVADREQVATANVLKPRPPGKLGNVLDADFHQKLTMQFFVKDKMTGKPMKIHQAFVVFIHTSSQQEIVFVAEPDTKLLYKFDVDLLKSAKDFEYLSGKYLMRLVLGDAVVGNPMSWNILDVNLKFPAQDKKKKGEEGSYQKLPEIRHVFREPEKPPPAVVSNAFTGLVLVPLLVLFILWTRIGVNISNFPISIFSMGFHLGLTAIFGLYFIFWLQLNMFQTLKYLIGIGSVTFICGNVMLRRVAERRKAKTA